MSDLRAVSLFAGIGGIDLALERAGIGVAAAVEIDRPARGVLSERFPATRLYEDVTRVHARAVCPHHLRLAGQLGQRHDVAGQGPGLDRPQARPGRGAAGEQDRGGVLADPRPGPRAGDDRAGPGCPDCLPDLDPRRTVLAAGFPCQDLSLAGRRTGLAGARSGLYWHVDRLLGELGPAWVLLENVPGLLSAVCPCPGDGACLERGLALRCPGGPHAVPGGACWGRCTAAHGGAMGAVLGSVGQRGYGFAYRVLDAQHFGVPQRRRRVFIVGRLGDRAAPVQVLLEPEGGRRDPAPGQPARQGPAPAAARRAAGPRWRVTEDVAAPVLAEGAEGRGHRLDLETLPGRVALTGDEDSPRLAGTLRAGGSNGPGDDPDRRTYVPVALALTASQQRLDGTVETLITEPVACYRKAQKAHHGEDGERWVPDHLAATLDAGGQGPRTAQAVVQPLAEPRGKSTGASDGAGIGVGGDGEPMYALQAGKEHAVAVHTGEAHPSPETGRYDATDVDAAQARSREALRAVRDANGEETAAEWLAGVAAALRAAQVLRSSLHGESVRREGEPVDAVVHNALARPEDDPAGAVSTVRGTGRQRRPPRRRRSHEQPPGQPDAVVSLLSQPGPRQEAALLGLREAAEGSRVLRQALSAMEEVGRPAHGKGEPAHGAGAAPRAAGGAGVSAVRRLTPRLPRMRAPPGPARRVDRDQRRPGPSRLRPVPPARQRRSGAGGRVDRPPHHRRRAGAGVTALTVRGDARALPLPDASVDLVVTSPPYFSLRSYTDSGQHYAGQIGDEPDPREYLDNLLKATAEWARVLKPAGSLWVNLGDKYAERTGPERLADADSDAYVRRPNARRARRAYGFRPKSLMGLPWRYALACVDDLGLILRRDQVWDKVNAMPESTTDRTRSAHEYWFHLTKQARYYSAVDEIREPASGYDRASGARRQVPPGQRIRAMADTTNPLGALPGSVWPIPTEPLPTLPGVDTRHYAAFPTEWPRRLVLGWSPRDVCTACGQGRAPVCDRSPMLWRSSPTADSRAAPGATRATASGTMLRAGTTRIVGYACACTPFTLHPSAPRQGPRNSGKGWAADTGDRDNPGGGYGNAERTGPWREYHLEGWEPPPTTPGVVLDPFSGTGTTIHVASALGRVGIGVDLSHDYCRLATHPVLADRRRRKVLGLDAAPAQINGQGHLFDDVTSALAPAQAREGERPRRDCHSCGTRSSGRTTMTCPRCGTRRQPAGATP